MILFFGGCASIRLYAMRPGVSFTSSGRHCPKSTFMVHFGLMNILLRTAVVADLEAINNIYNHYVERSTCTYQEEPEPLESRKKWFESHHQEAHPIVVAELGGKVVGWGSLSPYHSRCAYRFTVENSIYVDHESHRQGVGTAILKDLVVRAQAIGYHAIIAAIDGSQEASISLHTRFGFTEVGHFRQVGFKFKQWLDVIYLVLILPDNAAARKGKA
jgi:L-amino acid N-acyltransferase YncA